MRMECIATKSRYELAHATWRVLLENPAPRPAPSALHDNTTCTSSYHELIGMFSLFSIRYSNNSVLFSSHIHHQRKKGGASGKWLAGRKRSGTHPPPRNFLSPRKKEGRTSSKSIDCNIFGLKSGPSFRQNVWVQTEGSRGFCYGRI